MTLIATTVNNNCPVMIADILVSGSDSEESIRLPTNAIDITPYLPKLNRYPVVLNQKLYILRPNLCVQFAGALGEIEKFLKAIKRHLNEYEGDITNQVLLAFLQSNSFPDDGSLIYLLYLVDKTAEMPLKIYYYPDCYWLLQDNEEFGNAFASGSGKETFMNELYTYGFILNSHTPDTPLKTLSSNISMVARLLAAERISLLSITELWGAGYELAYYNGSSFEKCDDYAYLIFSGAYNESGDINNLKPELVLYYKYFDTYLGITAIEPKTTYWNEQDGMYVYSSYMNKQNFYVVAPFEVNEIEQSLLPEDFSFRTSLVGLGYGLTTESKKIHLPSGFSNSPYNLNIDFIYKNRLEIRINKLIDTQLRLSTKDNFINLADS